ncbi:MAG TPA: hypothetical protein VJR89_17070, partial [Polyangiales bacterium]|nr:hypothetical protein [Polyangiales bacterium]
QPVHAATDAQISADAGPIDAMSPVHDDDDDAGTWVPPEPACTEGVWRLAPGFRVAMPLDYIADRETPSDLMGLPTGDTILLSEAGVACATASDRKRCLDVIHVSGGIRRHLLTTGGDSVRLWNLELAPRVLGMIDTPAEAIWWLLANNAYLVPCEAEVVASELGYVVKGALSVVCGTTPSPAHRPIEVRVEPSGIIAELGPSDPLGPICASSSSN